VYCSNPLDFARHDRELDTETWRRVFREAEALGVVQVHLTGGEPLVRSDLEPLIEQARALDLYTNLITSGIPLTRERLAGFRQLGLDNVQVSIKDVAAPAADRIAGLRSFERKLAVASWVKELGFPLTLNVVPSRQPRAHRGGGALAESWAPTGWSWRTRSISAGALNRPALPTRGSPIAPKGGDGGQERPQGRIALLQLPGLLPRVPEGVRMDGGAASSWEPDGPRSCHAAHCPASRSTTFARTPRGDLA
jgi:pyrroloquinoline quinone biosynthesis protein E